MSFNTFYFVLIIYHNTIVGNSNKVFIKKLTTAPDVLATNCAFGWVTGFLKRGIATRVR